MLLQFSVLVVSYSRGWRQPIKFISRHVLCDKQCYASLIWSTLPPQQQQQQKKHSNKEKKDPVYFHYQYLLFFMCQTQMNYEYFALHSSHDTNHWSFFLLGQ